jgi:hypothetical protein
LLIKDYDKYDPESQRHYGHNFVRLVDEALVEFNLRALRTNVADEPEPAL